MNTTHLVGLIALACAGLSPVCGGEAGEAGEVRMRPTGADLAKRMEARRDPLTAHRDLEPVVAAESIRKRPTRERLGSLLDRSAILSYGKYWTLVPKGAVLHVPPGYQDRLGSRPDAKLLPWNDFYARNKGWIFAQPVSMENARGEQARSEAVVENHRQLGRVVVAVLKSGPISVRAPRSESADPEPDQHEAPSTEAP